MSSAALVDVLINADPETVSTPRQARQLVRQARRLRRCDLLQDWLIELAQHKTAPTCNDAVIAANNASSADRSDVVMTSDACLDAKAREHLISAQILRIVLKRGLVEHFRAAQLSDQQMPITARDAAQARVNAFIRLCQGDPTARDDDADLLPRR